MAEIDEKYLKHENYVNRELSWLNSISGSWARQEIRPFRCLSG